MKKWITALFILAILVAVGGYYYRTKYLNRNRVIITLPGGEVVEAIKSSMKDAEIRNTLTPGTIRGKIEQVRTSILPNDTVTRTVMITNEGELVMLLNPEATNALRYQYSGRILTLKGRWFGETPFRGKMYKTLWIEEISDVEKTPAVIDAGIVKSANKSVKRK